MNLYVNKIQRPRGRCSCGQPGRMSLRVYKHPRWIVADRVGSGRWCGLVTCLVKAISPHNHLFATVEPSGGLWLERESIAFERVLKRLYRDDWGR